MLSRSVRTNRAHGGGEGIPQGACWWPAAKDGIHDLVCDEVPLVCTPCGQIDKHASVYFILFEASWGEKWTPSDDRKLEKTRGMGSLPQIHPFRSMLANGY